LETKKEMRVYENYGPVKTDQDYQVVEEGYDYTTLRCRGKNICVPNTFFQPSYKTKLAAEIEFFAEAEDEEDYYEEEY